MSFFGGTTWQGDIGINLPRLPRCGECGLYKQCQSPKMLPSGRGKKPILIVGEAPGQKEDDQGKQFVGKTGQHLRKILKRLGVDLEDCTVTNSIICHPQNNRIEDKHVEYCRPNLLRTVRETKPRVIILLGAKAVLSLIPPEKVGGKLGGISRLVGWRIPYHEHGAWVCPTWHPSYIMRMSEGVLDKMWEEHLRAAIALEGTPIALPPLKALQSQCELVLSSHEAHRRLQALARREGRLAFDYETTGLKPDPANQRIWSVSFCLDGVDTWATPMHEDILPALKKVLTNPALQKVGANIKFEERWTVVKLGYRVRGWFWDTMLATHYLDNRGDISSLKFQSFVRFGVGGYEAGMKPYLHGQGKDGLNRIHEAPLKELLLYNALDSLLEYKLMEVQRKEMGLE